MITVDLEMPKCCAYCPMHNKWTNVCKATNEYLFTFPVWEKRKENCPIQEQEKDWIPVSKKGE